MVSYQWVKKQFQRGEKMKKLITILTILMVATIAIFASATDQHSIKITVTIDSVEPTFVLNTTSGAEIKSTASGSGVEAALDSSNVDILNGTAAATADVGFAIVQNSLAKSVSLYKMSVSVSDLVLVSTNVPNGLNRTFDVALANATADERFTVAVAAPSISSGATVEHLSYPTVSPSDEYFRVQYNGVVDGSTNNITVGTFTASYNANSAAKPGNYVSTVTLSIVTP